MPIDNVQASNIAAVKANTETNNTQPNSVPDTAQNEEHNYKKYLKVAGIATAAIAVGCGIVHFVKKGKVPEITDAVEFLKKDGVAYKKGSDELFSGTVKKSLKDGNVMLEYKDGLIQKSVKEGENGFTKVYNYGENGTLNTIEKTVDGKTETIDIIKQKEKGEKLAKEAKEKEAKEAGRIAKEETKKAEQEALKAKEEANEIAQQTADDASNKPNSTSANDIAQETEEAKKEALEAKGKEAQEKAEEAENVGKDFVEKLQQNLSNLQEMQKEQQKIVQQTEEAADEALEIAQKQLNNATNAGESLNKTNAKDTAKRNKNDKSTPEKGHNSGGLRGKITGLFRKK